MFTGIIESTGIVQEINGIGSNVSFWIESPISHELKPDQSVAHNGVCLTVEEVKGRLHKVTAVQETLTKTTLKQWRPGELVNLERCMSLNGRLDGHIVQGHVDAVATCIKKTAFEGSWEFDISIPAEYAHLVIEKGSICLNGISLTTFNVHDDRLTVAIIPYTYEHTSMNRLMPGQPVNVEYDVIGKYVSRIIRMKQLISEMK